LVFAVNESQLSGILREVLPALRDEGKFWIAFPKSSSKIVTDLNRDCSWDCVRTAGYEEAGEVTLDHVWTAMRFCKCAKPGNGRSALSRKRVAAVMAD
jgi:hypothetical protein